MRFAHLTLPESRERQTRKHDILIVIVSIVLALAALLAIAGKSSGGPFTRGRYAQFFRGPGYRYVWQPGPYSGYGGMYGYGGYGGTYGGWYGPLGAYRRFPPAGSPMPAMAGPEIAAPVDDRAHVMVRVPADAEVWVDGAETQQRGVEREFVSPPLEGGRNFVYTIRARWQSGNDKVDQTRKVPVHAGDRVMVDFLER